MLVVALVSLGVLAYTYVGFPALIVLLSRLRPWRSGPAKPWEPTVTACVASHNGAAYLDQKIETLLAQDWPAEKLEILIYSDGSTDDSDAIVTAWSARSPNVRLVRGEQRRGKPTGLNRMRAEATGEVLLLTDVRQPLEPHALRSLIAALAPDDVGCATGNLVLRGSTGGGAYWKYEKVIRRAEGRFRSVVGMTGSISAVRRRDLEPLPEDVILDDVWIPMRLRLAGRRTVFVEDAVAYDTAFEDDKEFGRKVRTLAGNYQLFARMPALLSPLANPSWFETISHKVLRLVCPWAMIVMLIASAAAAFSPAANGWPRDLARVLFAGQALFYLAALVGGRGGKIAGLARTFVVLNAAAVVGLWRHLRGAQRITW